MVKRGGYSLEVRVWCVATKPKEVATLCIRVDAPDAADYEADFDRLERMTHGGFMYAPLDLHHEAVEVFGGLPRLQMRADGSAYDGGFRWDSTAIITATHSFQEELKTVNDMGERWASNTPITLKHLSAYQDDPETGESAAQQVAADIAETGHSGLCQCYTSQLCGVG